MLGLYFKEYVTIDLRTRGFKTECSRGVVDRIDSGLGVQWITESLLGEVHRQACHAEFGRESSGKQGFDEAANAESSPSRVRCALPAYQFLLGLTKYL